MSRPLSPIVCDGPGCSAQKREANHWWTAAIPKQEGLPLEIRLWEAASVKRCQSLKASWNLYDLCGAACASKFISEQMGKAAVPVQSPGDHQESNPGSQGGQDNAE